MLFKQALWPGIADGTITLAFRRWKRPAAVPGSRHRTPAGLVEIIAVGTVAEAEITDAEARRAGFADRSELLAVLDRREGDLYRIEFRHAGEDPRRELRERDRLTDAELAELVERLRRLDRAAPSGSWTLAVLELIGKRPAVLAAELAEELRRERAPFKRDVRKLKELGLTESLPVGYRLSRRGRAVLPELARRLERG